MNSGAVAPILRQLLETPFSGSLRRQIMSKEAQREVEFVQLQASRGSVQSFSSGEISSLVGPTQAVDTLFVLGSGASVEELLPENFREIALQRSVGINNWAVHPFVPDFFSFESVPWVGDGKDFPRALQLLQRREILEKSPLILVLRPSTNEGLSNLQFVPEALRKQVRLYGRVSPVTRDAHNLRSDIRSFFRYVSPRRYDLVMDSGASVVRMVSLGILLGFRRIVLTGVDLNGSPYFWERNPSYLENLVGPAPVNNQSGGVHETTDERNRPFSVVTMLCALSDYFRSELNGELLIASDTSALSGFLPTIDWRGLRP